MFNEEMNDTIRNYIVNSKYKGNSGRWVFANKVLYDLCADYIKHDDEHIIVTKIWLIGRSYAAAIERRKKTEEEIIEDFYYDKVAPAILKIGDKLDSNITEVNKMGSDLNDDQVITILKTHYDLTKVFNEITGMDKRSLASKYLHFHCPNHFFIYDSRAASNIGKFATKDKDLYNNIYNNNINTMDQTYCDFYLKALQISRQAKKISDHTLSPRDIDNIIYYI